MEPKEALKSVSALDMTSTIGFLSLLWKDIVEALLVFAEDGKVCCGEQGCHPADGSLFGARKLDEKVKKYGAPEPVLPCVVQVTISVVAPPDTYGL